MRFRITTKLRDVAELFEHFKEVIAECRKHYSPSMSEDWWRSRFYEWQDYQANDPLWEVKHHTYKMWPELWHQYRKEITGFDIGGRKYKPKQMEIIF